MLLSIKMQVLKAFLDGRKTTGIFVDQLALPKPKPENVEFFNNTKDAILKGYPYVGL